MFEFGWAEFLVIAAIALFVIGPQDIPNIAYQIGKLFRRLKYMQFALTSQFDDFMKQAEIRDEAQKSEDEPEKQELDHDPYDEAQADADLLDMMPLPPPDDEENAKPSPKAKKKNGKKT